MQSFILTTGTDCHVCIWNVTYILTQIQEALQKMDAKASKKKKKRQSRKASAADTVQDSKQVGQCNILHDTPAHESQYCVQAQSTSGKNESKKVPVHQDSFSNSPNKSIECKSHFTGMNFNNSKQDKIFWTPTDGPLDIGDIVNVKTFAAQDEAYFAESLPFLHARFKLYPDYRDKPNCMVTSDRNVLYVADQSCTIKCMSLSV
jgi:hypothetical protein